MEFASKLRWFLVIVAVVLFLVLIGWGLYSVASSIFRSGGGETDMDSIQQVESVVDDNLEFANTVSFTQRGPIIAKESQRSLTIEVNPSLVTMKVYGEYGQRLIEERSYTNSETSYQTFLGALETLGVPDRFGETTFEEDYDDNGVCPTGRVFAVEVDTNIRRWSTSCQGDNEGTAGFNMANVRQLFQRQVPDYSDIVSGVQNL